MGSVVSPKGFRVCGESVVSPMRFRVCGESVVSPRGFIRERVRPLLWTLVITQAVSTAHIQISMLAIHLLYW